MHTTSTFPAKPYEKIIVGGTEGTSSKLSVTIRWNNKRTMALNPEALRAAVNERRVEEPAFTEADLEAEKARLGEEIDTLEAQASTEEETSGLKLNNLRLSTLKDRLAALEKGGLKAMLTREQEEERVADEFNALMIAKYDGKIPKFDEEET